MVIDEGFADFADFEDLSDLRLSALSDLSSFNFSALGDFSDLCNVSSSRHRFLASGRSPEEVEQTGSGHTLNRVPPPEPQRKKCFLFFIKGFTMCNSYNM
jgi:hypothetical protein